MQPTADANHDDTIAPNDAIAPRAAAVPVRLLPYFLLVALLPFAALAIWFGGWWLLALYAAAILAPALVDVGAPLNKANPDPSTPAGELVLHQILPIA